MSIFAQERFDLGKTAAFRANDALAAMKEVAEMGWPAGELYDEYELLRKIADVAFGEFMPDPNITYDPPSQFDERTKRMMYGVDPISAPEQALSV